MRIKKYVVIDAIFYKYPNCLRNGKCFQKKYFSIMIIKPFNARELLSEASFRFRLMNINRVNCPSV